MFYIYGKLLITRFFWHVPTDEYLPHTVLVCKVIGPQSNIIYYVSKGRPDKIITLFAILMISCINKDRQTNR